jgi:murein DD-endopeptidase MepM/ murein hydrolase activator NlpD
VAIYWYMKKIYLIFLIIVVAVIFYLVRSYSQKNLVTISTQKVQTDFFDNQVEVLAEDMPKNDGQNFSSPIDRTKERVTKKPFGIFVTPQNSPVKPERFRGYHTGTDFEIFPEEMDREIELKAICSGKLLMKNYANGYGGIMIESCELDGKPITVIYGHLKLDSIKAKLGDSINAGDIIGILGADKSVETNGERKHLHLGLHKGGNFDIRGYVNSKKQLSDWIDPCLYVCN